METVQETVPSGGVRQRRRRRSLLVFPATELRMARKAALSDADCVIFDLEDAVPLERKSEGRALLEEGLAEIDFGGKEVCVRINGVNSPDFADDIEAINLLPVHAVVVPKVETAADVEKVDAGLSAGPGAAGPKLHLAVESPRGLFECRDFCQASPRVDAVLFGSGDFVASSGFSSDESALLFPRSHISLVASSLGIDALDLVFGSVKDVEGLRRSAAAGRDLGYAGKWVIHPGQVDVVNDVFSPSEDEVVRARRILGAMTEAWREGRGAVTLDGVLIDEASIRWAEVVVARSRPADEE